MAIPVLKSSSRKQQQTAAPTGASPAYLFLALACIWPIILLALFTASAPHHTASTSDGLSSSPHSVVAAGKKLGFQFRGVLDRVDVVGYGPTHPRVAVVIVGDNKDNLVITTESLFANTDMNRIFMVVVVVDGHPPDATLEQELYKIDDGAIPHWHGMRADLHVPGSVGRDEDTHGKKVHVLFNEKARGVSESRKDAIDFLQILERNHEESGLKSEQEDLILLLLQSGAQLTSHEWLKPVTEALIVPPPILEDYDETTVALKLANAVSFNLEGPGKRTAFDTTLTRVDSDVPATDLALSNGDSYPTPALSGAATALRLRTYINLPLQDLDVSDAWSANLDLALNLWLCGDGIDMLKDVEVTAFAQEIPAPLGPTQAARFAAAWMDESMQRKFFNAYSKIYTDLTYLEWETNMAMAMAQPHFSDSAQKCRSFEWYVQEINTELLDVLHESNDVQREAAVVEEVDDDDDAEIPVALPDKPLAVPEVDEVDAGGPDLSIPLHDERAKPQKPLCKECLEIVQKAQPIDITFVDMSGGHQDHPHMGAVDANGKSGYIHDETALHLHPDTFSVEAATLQGMCSKRDNNYKMLTEKVFVDLDYDKMKTEEGKERAKIFCLAYTTSSGHERIKNIRQTWGPKCDGFMAASNQTDPSIGTVNILHEGEEDYKNIWQKVRSMWSYIYDNYYEKYDWFHIGGDDLYLLVENLRYYLESEEIQTAANGGVYLPKGNEKEQIPLLLGRRFAYMGDMNDIFTSGGSGYTMNKAALKRLVVDGLPNQFPHAHTFSEDTMIAKVFKQYGVFPYETKDENGGERYMPFMPGHHYGYRMPSDHSKDWYAKYSINIKEGVDHCSAHSVAFHYVKDLDMQRLHALLYHLCPVETQ